MCRQGETTMSLQELEKLKFDWAFAVPGCKTTRCCATGTCMMNVYTKKLNLPKISIQKDRRDPHVIKKQYGSLRNASLQVTS